jgi:hypothetical protein
MEKDAIYIQGFAGALAESCRSRQSHLAAIILRATEIRSAT